MLDSSSSRLPLSSQLSAENSADQFQKSDAGSRLVDVLHVINGEHYSGAERVQDLLAARLPESGYRVSFACVKPGIFAAKRTCQSAPVADVEMRHRFDLTAVTRVVQLIKEHHIKLVHAHTPRSALIGGLAAQRCKVPFVFHVHSPTSRDSTRRWINWVNQKIENWSIRRAAKIVTVSDSLKMHMVDNGFAADKLVVVPNGVPVPSTVELRRTDSPVPFTIGTVALFRPRKGTEVLMESMQRLVKRGIDCRLLAVGPFESSDYEEKLKSLSIKLGLESVIEWTGFTKNVAAHFTRMDAFCLPSLFGEGLPMVVLEAMAYGVPVVATNVEGVPQAIRDGIDGMITKAGDSAGLAKGLERLIENAEERNRFSQSARKRQAECFSDKSMAKKLAQVYDEILLPV